MRVNATQLLFLEADPALSGLSEEGKQNLIKQILLDGGSDTCILNRFYRHLFFRITKLTHRCLLSGIGGDTDMKITHSGSISFTGCTIHNVYYCAELSKSIVSKSVMCQANNFRILKLLTSLSTKVILDHSGGSIKGFYILPIELCAHSPIIHKINLASVRPSYPLTLWHNRLGHSYTGLIQRMAKLSLYRDRGLIIPDEFLVCTI